MEEGRVAASAKALRQACAWLVGATVRKLVLKERIREIARMGWGGCLFC